jgi:hypothetical protein
MRTIDVRPPLAGFLAFVVSLLSLQGCAPAVMDRFATRRERSRHTRGRFQCREDPLSKR